MSNANIVSEFGADTSYHKMSATAFSETTTTLADTGGKETVLVINESTGAMTVYEWFEGDVEDAKWYQSTNTFTPA